MVHGITPEIDKFFIENSPEYKKGFEDGMNYAIGYVEKLKKKLKEVRDDEGETATTSFNIPNIDIRGE